MAAKTAKGANAGQEKATVEQVERELAGSTSFPDEVVAEMGDVEIAEDEVLTAARLRHVWGEVRKRDAGCTKALQYAERDKKQAAEHEQALKKQEAELKEQWERAEARDAELARAEEEVEKARMKVREGFADERRELLKSALKRHEEVLTETAELEERARKAAQASTEKALSRLEAEQTKLTAGLEVLHDQQRTLGSERERLRRQRELDESTAAALAEHYERRIEGRLAAVHQELEDTNDKIEIERDLSAKRGIELQELRRQLAAYGDDPDELRRHVDELRTQVGTLHDELARRPAERETLELRKRADLADDALTQADDWRQKYERAARDLSYQLIAVGELEMVRDQRDALQTKHNTLRQVVDDLRSEWEELQHKESAKEPFPACSGYDGSRDLQMKVATRNPESLADLVAEARDRMALNTATAYYYSESDVRLFLAGLAASRLHLLQGISGTGKTSLPREFFRALGGKDTVVEVQAGWRDKDDLFGYYNAFEKRFAESEFTKALYRALLPAHRDLPTVIVLDEMNLAHPEQYFGTMLSALENDTEYLDLVTSELPGSPKLLAEGKLPLAGNVWFVGTANHDETTVAFADKTYDRAHVQELPDRHEPFTPASQGELIPVSWTGLQRSFDDAAHTYRAEARKAWDLLNGDLRALFAAFGIGWGSRLERQVLRFVPAVRAGGGTATEAVDHLVATKLVRKLEDRFGIRAEDLDQLGKDIERVWNLDRARPEKTLARLHREVRRLSDGLGR